ncbi:MAG TPA: DUF1501 domain-containing protein [Verrucomicrobiales bacterium]|nr:DUF1501 domain-containing protein [Verrucomicrobiales bacterium]
MTPMRFPSRREALYRASCGFGYLALAGLSAQDGLAAGRSPNPLAPRPSHFPARAKRVIFLFMQGGPSHHETFDYKPELIRLDGKPAGGIYPGGRSKEKLLGPRFDFAPRGISGLMISDLYPHLAQHADDLCVLNGMHTDNPAHAQATIMLHTGSINFVRPSMGAWITYGLGTLSENLPGFVTINPATNVGGAQNYGAAFLPATYQGARARAGRDSIRDIRNPEMARGDQRRQLDLVQSLNRSLLERVEGNPELEGVIESYELAFRMQFAAPEVMDISREPAPVRRLYGLDRKVTEGFGTQCLMARRLAEAGVRFIQVTHRGWDQHNNLTNRLAENCAQTDQPIAALLSDLKERGLLDDTLVLWGGEFGRSPDGQGPDGRRHNNRGYSMWMAGGGVRGGVRYGATDPLGAVAVEDKMHTHDLHATILHLLGIDHTKLTYRYAGRDFRLTDVYGDVARGVLG